MDLETPSTASTSSLALDPAPVADLPEPPRKRARTGKARKEAKALAIAKKEAEDATESAAGREKEDEETPEMVIEELGKEVSRKRKRSLDRDDGVAPSGKALHPVASSAAGVSAEPPADPMSADQEEQGIVPDETDVIVEGPVKQTKADLEVVQKRIPQALKSLLPILKKSKTVESQRLIKKIKFLRNKRTAGREEGEGGEAGDGEVKDLEEQFEVLKKLDLHTIIPSLLLSKLNKHPLMRSYLPLTSTLPGFSALFPSNADDPSTSSASATQSKLENKLYSSKGVGPQIKAVVGWCVGEEGVKLTGPSVNGGTKGIRKGHQEKEVPVIKVRPAKESMNEARKAALLARGDAESDSGSDSDDGSEGPRRDVPGSEDGDEDGWESGSVDDTQEVGPGQDAAKRSARLRELEASDEEGGDDIIINSDYDDDDDEKDSAGTATAPPARPKQPSKPTKSPALPPLKQPKPGAAITSSFFLPSLSTGFVRGENRDEDYGLDVDERRENKKGGERKNRRGQAERRAIWEKKYGKGANHIKKAQQEEATKAKIGEFEKRQGGALGDSRWGAAPSTTMPSTGAGRDRTMHGKGSVADRMAGKKADGFKALAPVPAAAISKPDKPKTQNDPPKALHPSWEAARLKKLKEGSGIVVPQGKKIVF